ncbi:hypothetical protein FVE89_02690 [Methylobacterium sp. 2A]|jgi:hypothetical protein|nr:hypothetical protein [Methylobacterium sp. 2A]
MLANARDARRRMMRTSDLHPPRAGLNSDPILYGVAAGLAALFPPVKTSNAPTEPTRADQAGRSQGTTDAP